MNPAAHKATLHRAAAAFNTGDWDGYFALYDPAIRAHGFPMDLAPGLDGLQQFYAAFGTAFPEPRFTIESLVAEGDRVAVQYTLRATHTGVFMEVPPTGRPIEVGGMTLLRFCDGKVIERWQYMNDLGFLQQLGAIPAPA